MGHFPSGTVREGKATSGSQGSWISHGAFQADATQRFAPAFGFLAGTVSVEIYFGVTGGLFVPVELIFPVIGLLVGIGINTLIGAPSLVLTPWTAEVTKLRQRIIWWPDVREIRVERHQFMRMIVIYE